MDIHKLKNLSLYFLVLGQSKMTSSNFSNKSNDLTDALNHNLFSNFEKTENSKIS